MNWQDQWHNVSKGGYPICDVKTIDCDDGKLLSVVFWIVDQTTGFQEHAVYLCEPDGKCRYERQGNFDLIRATPPAEPATTDVESVLAEACKQAHKSLAEHRCGFGSCHCCRSMQAIDAALELRRKATNNITLGRDIFRDENRSIVDIDSV